MSKNLLQYGTGQPIDFVIETETGEILSKIRVPSSLVGEFIEISKENNLKFFNYIDFYGDTIFNEMQMKDMINECNVLLSIVSRNELIILLREIISLCQRGIKEPHLYLKIYGN